MTELRRFLTAPKSQKLTLTLPMDYIQKKSFYAMCSPETKALMDGLEKLIDDATSDYTTAESWPTIMAVVDKLNSLTDNEVRNESIRMVRMRLAHFSPTVVLSALHLTEAIVKNCGKSIRTRIAHPKFMSTMELLYKEHRGKVGQSHLLICERVLELIQGWGEAFLPHRRELPGFSDTYHKMCKEGVPFPAQYDASRAPVLSPPRNGTGVPGIPGTEVHVPPAARPSEPNSFRSLGPDETFHVTNNVLEMVEDMLAESAKSNHVEVLENDILHDLHGQLVQLQQHLLVVIEREASSGSENLDKLLTLNDAIQAAHNMFVAATSSQVASSPRRKHKPDRDEAEDNAVMSPKKAPRGADVMSKANVPDDDPFAAFAQERVRKQQSVVLNTAESTHPVPVAAASDAPVAAPAVVVQDLISWDDRDEVVARAACGVMAGHAPPPRNPFDAFVLAVPPPRRTTSTNPFDLI